MRKSGLAILLLTMVSLGGIVPLVAPATAYADSPTGEMRPDAIKVSCKYPSASGPADTQFMFQLEINYQLTDVDPGMEMADTGRLQSRVFNVELSGPSGWEVFMAESSWATDTRVSAMRLTALGVPQQMVIVATAPWWENLAPGEYPIHLTLASDEGELESSVDLKAIITAWYGIEASTTDYRLNTKTTAGSPAEVELKVTNTGSAALNKVSVTSTKPTGIANEQWMVRFDPDSLKGLEPGQEGEVKVSITPPEDVISGDYYVTLTLASEPALSDFNPTVQLRVSVETRPAWVFVGVAVVVLAFGALIYAFYALRQR